MHKHTHTIRFEREQQTNGYGNAEKSKKTKERREKRREKKRICQAKTKTILSRIRAGGCGGARIEHGELRRRK